jgi:PKD repeat protein
VAVPCHSGGAGGCDSAAATAVVSPAVGAVGNWTELFPTNYPSGRTQPGFAYDPAIQAVVLFGGYSPYYGALSDTWTFANNSWTQLSTNLSGAPAPRWGASMVWDAADGYLVLFGGRNYVGYFNDTWTFNGTAWTNVTGSVAPPTRSLFEMAYDPVDREVIVDGGARLDLPYGGWENVNDTWAYSAGNWTNITSAAPGGALDRAGGQAAYDPWNGSVVFVGGGSTVNWTAGCTPIDPVQTYVNGSWYEYPSSVGPPQLSQEMLTYDPAGPFLFLFGGFEPSGTGAYTGCIQTNATWVRSAGVWYNLTSSLTVSPGLRYLSGIAYDPISSEVVLFGGNGAGAYLDDTWVYRIVTLATTIHASRLYGLTPLSVGFDAQTLGGAAVTGYNWSFGDGASALVGPTVNHTFTQPGTYNVSVNVSGTSNTSFVASVLIHVAATLQVGASASIVVGSVPLKVMFNGYATGGFAPYRYNWSFGDGAYSSLANVSHVYARSGNFTAILAVYDMEGDVNRSSVTVGVDPQLVVTASGSVVAGVAPLWVNFTSTSSGGTGADTYQWSFGDGTGSTLPNPTHEYSVAGDYVAVLTVTDTLGRSANATIPIVVFPAMRAAVQTADLTGLAPFGLTLEANVSGGDAPYTYTWSFGDGSPDESGAFVSHTFVRAGSYTVDLYANDSLGDPAQATASILVVAPLSIKIATSSSIGEAPDPVTLTFASFSGGEAPYTFAWTFGDGTTASGGSEANHSYAHAGGYTAKVSVGDAVGEDVSASVSITVLAPVSLAVGIGFGSVYDGSPVNLTVDAGGGATPYAYAWTGLPTGCDSENASSITCIPTAVGSFNVSVTVTDGYGRLARTNGTVVVLAAPPTSTNPAGGGGSFPIWYAIVGFILAAAVVVLVAYWAGRRRGESGGPPSSSPDGPPENYSEGAPAEFADEGGPPPA